MIVMESEGFPDANVTDEKLCITQFEQKEYDSCSWENEDFVGKTSKHPHTIQFEIISHC